ncbi:pentapeptide repeat-containing protein [Mesorhizobium sp. AR07]|uniref:pentapeptide repeat-containing protein n=1 Tax=Mesorhizobium sp. AR07 TaxID=2865838 RepID=UPI00220590DB|nr:pentapeptide repeat-containing protein [Mesorhizobium sp. AR07]
MSAPDDPAKHCRDLARADLARADLARADLARADLARADTLSLATQANVEGQSPFDRRYRPDQTAGRGRDRQALLGNIRRIMGVTCSLLPPGQHDPPLPATLQPFAGPVAIQAHPVP